MSVDYETFERFFSNSFRISKNFVFPPNSPKDDICMQKLNICVIENFPRKYFASLNISFQKNVWNRKLGVFVFLIKKAKKHRRKLTRTVFITFHLMPWRSKEPHSTMNRVVFSMMAGLAVGQFCPHSAYSLFVSLRLFYSSYPPDCKLNAL